MLLLETKSAVFGQHAGVVARFWRLPGLAGARALRTETCSSSCARLASIVIESPSWTSADRAAHGSLRRNVAHHQAVRAARKAAVGNQSHGVAQARRRSARTWERAFRASRARPSALRSGPPSRRPAVSASARMAARHVFFGIEHARRTGDLSASWKSWPPRLRRPGCLSESPDGPRARRACSTDESRPDPCAARRERLPEFRRWFYR